VRGNRTSLFNVSYGGEKEKGEGLPKKRGKSTLQQRHKKKGKRCYFLLQEGERSLQSTLKKKGLC